MKERVKVTLDGRAIVRKNKKYIYEGEFRNNEALTHARLPPNICEIRSRAFSGCGNLEEIRFEGSSLESIGEEAFAGCQKLRSMSLPDDTFVYCYAFRGCTGLESPIFNDSGTVLYAHPVSRKDFRYCVPDGVRKISSTAFLDKSRSGEAVNGSIYRYLGYLNKLPITTLYHHPDSKPDRNSFPPYLFSIMGQAISASFKRNGNKRKENAFFIPMS